MIGFCYLNNDGIDILSAVYNDSLAIQITVDDQTKMRRKDKRKRFNKI